MDAAPVEVPAVNPRIVFAVPAQIVAADSVTKETWQAAGWQAIQAVSGTWWFKGAVPVGLMLLGASLMVVAAREARRPLGEAALAKLAARSRA